MIRGCLELGASTRLRTVAYSPSSRPTDPGLTRALSKRSPHKPETQSQAGPSSIQPTGYRTMTRRRSKSCRAVRLLPLYLRKAFLRLETAGIRLGSIGIICNLRTKLCSKKLVKVADRGPFGAVRGCEHGKPKVYCVAGKCFKPRKMKWRGRCVWWQAQPRKLQPGFKYRGKFDLTKPVAKDIKHRAFDTVVFIYTKKKIRLELW